MTYTETATSEPCTERAGDPAALERLYREHGGAVLRLCRRRLGNDRDAEDASQETLLRAWRRLDAFDPSRPLWPWLATIAANVCIDFQRREQLRTTRRAPDDALEASPEDAVLAADDEQLVRQALRQLPAASQTVLYLREVEGWSYGEISLREGRSAPAVRTAVTRARQQLRAQIEIAARAAGRWPLVGALLVLAGRRRGGSHLAPRPAASAASGLRWMDPAMLGSASSVGTVVAQLLCGAALLASLGASHHPTGHAPGSYVGVEQLATEEPAAPPREDRPVARHSTGDRATSGVAVGSPSAVELVIPLAPAVPLPLGADITDVAGLDHVTLASAPVVALPAVGVAADAVARPSASPMTSRIDELPAPR